MVEDQEPFAASIRNLSRSSGSVDDEGDEDDGEGDEDGGSVVTSPVQSNIPSFTIRALILTGFDLEVLDSVNARDAANVPPKKLP